MSDVIGYVGVIGEVCRCTILRKKSTGQFFYYCIVNYIDIVFGDDDA